MAMFSWLTGMGGGVTTGIYYFLFALPVIILLIWLIVWFRNKQIYVYRARIFKIREGEKYKEVNFKAGYINRKNNAVIQIAKLNEHKSIATIDSTSLEKQSFELLPETKKILGYNCKKAKTIINSNTLEIWYTTEVLIKGAPSI